MQSYFYTLPGWTFALLMATMPLLGISDYRKFAVCLPFQTSDGLSLGFVIFLMLINGVAFSILMGCYLKMYCAIRGSQAWNSNDSRIAKRMALLVFTDFICWAPIGKKLVLKDKTFFYSKVNQFLIANIFTNFLFLFFL